MGKDNIVFHTVIWPSDAARLRHRRRARCRKGRPPPSDERRRERVPDDGGKAALDEPVNRDLRQRLPRALRPGSRCATTSPPPGPRRRTRDFTWEEFVRRNNDELLANWGNLVNRTLTNAHRNFGEVPRARRAHRRGPRGPRGRRGRLRRRSARSIEEATASSRRSPRRCALSTHREPVRRPTRRRGPLIKTDRERAATILFVALRIVDSLKMIFTPFLPFTIQKLHELLGYEGCHRRAARVPGDRGGRDDRRTRSSRATTRAGSARWEPSELPAGQKLREPSRSSGSSTPSIVGGRARSA